MAIYTDLPIYKATYSLLLAFSRMLPDMPRDCRYSIGQDARQKLMDIILLVYRANRTRQKGPVISRMRECLLEVQVYIRLMCDLKYISEKRYVNLMDMTVQMSRQMAAWQKSEIRKNGERQIEETD
jgi:hypothetical protein